MRGDFGDLRFTNDSDTPLDYWVEAKTDGFSATLWVEVDAIAASDDTTIYMYYGNSGASSESNGVNTFDWFDDFEDGSISGSYTKTGYDGWSEAGGILTFTTGGTTFSDPNVLIIDNKTYGWGYEIRGKIRVRQWQNHDYSRMGLGLRTEAVDGYGYKGLFHWRSGNKTRAILHNWVSWLAESNFDWSLDTWHWIGFYTELEGTTRYLYEKDWLVGDAEPGWLLTTSSTSTTHQDGQPCIAGSSIPDGGFATQFIGDWDDVLVRKCIYPDEPTYSVDLEECNSPPDQPADLGPTEYVDGSWVDNNTPTLEFTQYDPDGDDIQYTIQIDNEPDFLDPLMVNETSGLSSHPGEDSFTSPALPDGDYFWRVMSTDEHGFQSAWSVANGGDIAFHLNTATEAGWTSKDTYRTNQNVYVSGSGFTPGSDVDVYVVRDYKWNDSDSIPPDAGPVFASKTFTADGEGEIENEVIWEAPLEIGEYDIAFDADCNSDYDEIPDLVDDPNHPGFTVVKTTVGGTVRPIDKAAILLPWLGLGAVLILAAGGLILVRRATRLR